jgi:hypothetical protein
MWEWLCLSFYVFMKWIKILSGDKHTDMTSFTFLWINEYQVIISPITCVGLAKQSRIDKRGETAVSRKAQQTLFPVFFAQAECSAETADGFTLTQGVTAVTKQPPCSANNLNVRSIIIQTNKQKKTPWGRPPIIGLHSVTDWFREYLTTF